MKWSAQIAYLGLSLLLLGLSLAPVFYSPSDDAYPFSTYPMFAKKRKAPTFSKAEGLLKNGDYEPIPPQYLGTSELMQAVVTVRKAAKNKKSARRLCRSILKAAPPQSYKKVRIVRVKYDPIEYFLTGPRPLERRVIASCDPQKTKRKKSRRHSGKPRP